MTTKPKRDHVDLASLRLDWAGLALARLICHVDDFLAKEPCQKRRKITSAGNGDAVLSYFLTISDQPPPEISFAAGDVIHNLRATLDNLLWGIGQRRKAGRLLSLEFWGSEEKFNECYAPRISKLPEPIKDWVESVQPFNTRGFQLYKILTTLWNNDKHRSPQNIVTAAGMSMDWVGSDDPKVRNPMKSWESFDPGGQKDNQLLVRAIVPYAQRDLFTPVLSQFVAFSESGKSGAQNQEVVEYLSHVHSHITDRVLPIFEPFRN